MRTLCWVVILALLSGVAFSQEVYVGVDGNNTETCGTPQEPCGTIEYGVWRADDNGTVIVMEGIYPVDTLITIFKSLTIQGQNASVVCRQSPDAFLFVGNVQIEGFSLSNCSLPVINIKGNETVIRDCKFHDNPGTHGGGCVYMYDSGARSLIIQNSEFTDNSGGNGGAIYSHGLGEDDLLLIENCTFHGNTNDVYGSEGGAVDAEAHTTILRNNTFVLNRSARFGGAVIIASAQKSVHQLIVDECRFLNNTVSNNSASGGGLYVSGSFDVTISNSYFSENTMVKKGVAPGGGGGAFLAGISSLYLTGSEFYSNSLNLFKPSLIGGAGLAVYNPGSGTVLVEKCLFSGNFINGEATYFGAHLALNGLESITVRDLTWQGTADRNTYSGNTVNGGWFSFVCSDTLTVENCLFDGNSLYSYVSSTSATYVTGGALYLQAKQVVLNNTQWSNNSHEVEPNVARSAFTGGIVGISAAEEIIVSNCTFDKNRVFTDIYNGPYFVTTGAFGVLSTVLRSTTIQSSTFEGNSLEVLSGASASFFPMGAAIYISAYTLSLHSLTIDDCTFANNQISVGWDVNPSGHYTPSGGGALALLTNTTDTLVTNSRFIENGCDYVGFAGTAQGGALFVNGARLRIDSCSFIGHLLHVKNLFCIDNLVTASGGAVRSQAVETSISNSLFLNNHLEVECNGNEAAIAEGAAFSASSVAILNNGTFINNSVRAPNARAGAATSISLIAEQCLFSYNECQPHPENTKNDAKSAGGALYTHSYVALTEVSFTRNKAPVGGAYALNDLPPNSTFTDVDYNQNEAKVGGGLFISNQDSSLSIGTFGTFTNNTAELYGGTAATPAYQLLTPHDTAVVYPGEKFTLGFVLVDCFNNPIGWDIYVLRVNVNYNAKFQSNIIGDAERTSEEYYEVSDAYFLGPPQNESLVEFVLESPSLQNFPATITFAVADCIPGHIYVEQSSLCTSCDPGMYTFNTETCYPCPGSGSCMDVYNTTALLEGNFEVKIPSGLWPQPTFTEPDTLISCPNPQACLELLCPSLLGEDRRSWIVDCNTANYSFPSNVEPSPYCAEGYTDRVCSRCVCSETSGCYYFDNGVCAACEEDIAIAFYVVMLGFLIVTGVFFTLPLGAVILVLGEIAVTGVLAFSGFMPWSAFISSTWMLLLVSAMGDRINSSALKTLVTYFQFCGLLINPAFWPENFPAGGDEGTTAMLSSFDCLVHSFAERPEWKYVLSMSLPIFLIALVLFFSVLGYGIRKLWTTYIKQRTLSKEPSESYRGLLDEERVDDDGQDEDRDIEKEEQVTDFPVNTYTLRAILFIAYSSYLTVTTAVLTILQPCDGDFTVFSPWLECSFDNSTYLISYVSALVFAVIYVLGIPAIFGALLYRYRHQLHTNSAVGKAVEFLHEEFRPQMYYYELVWMTRRLLLAMGMMLISADTPWRFGFCVFVIGVSLFLQSVNQPFVHRFDNFVEIMSMLSVLILYSVSEVAILMGVDDFPGFVNVWAEVYFVILLGLLLLTFAPLFLSRFEWYRKWRGSLSSSKDNSRELDDVSTSLSINLTKRDIDEEEISI